MSDTIKFRNPENLSPEVIKSLKLGWRLFTEDEIPSDSKYEGHRIGTLRSEPCGKKRWDYVGSWSGNRDIWTYATDLPLEVWRNVEPEEIICRDDEVLTIYGWIKAHESVGKTPASLDPQDILAVKTKRPKKELVGTYKTPQRTHHRQDIFDFIDQRRTLQDKKYGRIEDKPQSVAGFLLVLEQELQEAKDGWAKNKEGKHSCLNEILDIAATATACLEKYGIEGNPL